MVVCFFEFYGNETFEKCPILSKFKSKIPDFEREKTIILNAPLKYSGTGISKEDLNRVFKPFYTKKAMGRSGTGLGLAIVWGTVKDHNGYVDVNSVKGEGTTFTLYSPSTREAVFIGESGLNLDDYSGSGESILVIDDDELQRNLCTSMLEKLNYSAGSVSSGEGAIEYLANHSVKLLILDMILDGGIDGLETYKRIIDIHPSQKAIIASGFTESDRVKNAQEMGAGTYVKKPYNIEELGMAVKNELRGPGNV